MIKTLRISSDTHEKFFTIKEQIEFSDNRKYSGNDFLDILLEAFILTQTPKDILIEV